MSLVKFSNNYPTIFDRFFDNNFYDWTSENYSTTNTTVPSANTAMPTWESELQKM